MERYSEQRAPGGDRVIDVVGPVEVRSVTFAYDRGIDVLHDVSFRIDPGEVVGMIGPSGSGKSTLVQLLLGLREPTSGTVEADGVDLREIDRRSWTPRTAFVAQDALLISGTIAENIAFFRDTSTATRSSAPRVRPTSSTRSSPCPRVRQRGWRARRQPLRRTAATDLHRQSTRREPGTARDGRAHVGTRRPLRVTHPPHDRRARRDE